MIKKPRPYGSIEQNSKVKNQGDQTLVKISQKIAIEKAKLPLKSYTVIAKIHFISVPSWLYNQGQPNPTTHHKPV